ncbi:MAG: YjbQ family protein [Gemmatimonadetes bacterium]|nr:YjbQ family protein [Gemmatimonadota bacterium]NIO32411.1 YjbQ family protein [Gemmatimonadota bacterium]
METLEIRTSSREELVEITGQVREAVRRAGVNEGVAHLWSFHTTCGLTVNEGADPNVARDIAWKLGELVPHAEAAYRHAEGNSDSHVKTSLINPGATLLVADGDIVLGTWQAVFLAEFDGPRVRKVGLQVVAAG